jgi:hypothetical protein
MSSSYQLQREIMMAKNTDSLILILILSSEMLLSGLCV